MSILSLLMCLWRIKSINFFKINIFDLTPFWTVMYYLLFVVWNFYNIFYNSVFVILIICAVNIKVCLCFPWCVPFKSCLPYSRSKSLNKEGKQLEAITLGRRGMCQAEGTHRATSLKTQLLCTALCLEFIYSLSTTSVQTHMIWSE